MFPGKSADEKKMAVHLLVIYFQYVEPNPPMSPWSSPWKVYTWTASVTGPVTDDNKPSVWKQFFKYLWFTSLGFLFGAGANVVFKKKLQKQRHETKSIRFFRRNLECFVGVVSLVNWLTVLLSVSKTRQGAKGLCQLWIRVLRFSEGLGHKDGGQVHHDLAEKAPLFGPLEVHCRSCRA